METQTDGNYDLIVACVGNGELDEILLNIAYKKSRLLNCPWKVLHIYSEKFESALSPYSEAKLQRLMKKAAMLKAEIVHIPSSKVSEELAKFTETIKQQYSNIIFYLCKNRAQRFFLFKKSSHSVIRHQLEKLGIKHETLFYEGNLSKNYAYISPIFNFNGLTGIFEATIFCAIGFLAGFLLQNYSSPHQNVIYLIYLMLCSVSSIRGGMIPGLIAAVLSVTTISFFFLEPKYTFKILDFNDSSDLLMFFLAAIGTSLIGSGSRRYILESRQKEAYLDALLNVSETLNRPLNEGEALAYIHNELEGLFASEIAFFTPNFLNKNILGLAYPAKTNPFSEDEKKAFDICHKEYRSTGTTTSTYPNSQWFFEPMMSPTGFQGVLAVKLATSRLRYDPYVIGILLGFADLSATIINRIEHTEIQEQTRMDEEKEKLRTMLLSSVSHDLKTPLASIIGSLDVHRQLRAKLDPKSKKALLDTALQEARRLDSFITNILDMAKLETGSVKFHKEWHKPKMLVEKALEQSKLKLGKRTISHVEGNDYEIEIDHNMMLRALSNLLDNISKYTGPKSAVSISYGLGENGKFSILIQDNGPGIEENMLEEIFNKYTRIKKQDAKIAGTGLGLPISKSIIESHDGKISAYNNPENGGAAFQITLPVYRPVNPIT